jgi:hypothetical protein
MEHIYVTGDTVGTPDDGDNIEYRLVALKRPWIPDAVFSFFGPLITHQPFRWMFTTPVEPDSDEE